MKFGKMSHFPAVCRSSDGRRGIAHGVEQNTVADRQVDMVNMNSLSFSSIFSVIAA